MNDDENPAEPSIGEKTISTATIGDKLLVSISDRRENPGEATFSLFIVERIDDPPLRLQLMRFEPIYTLIATSDPKYRFLMILTARRTIATSEISTGLFISFQQGRFSITIGLLHTCYAVIHVTFSAEHDDLCDRIAI